MFPLRDSVPSKNFPLVVVTLIAVNAMVFFYELTLGMPGIEQLFYEYGLVPADYGPGQTPPLGYLPFITSMFLHGSWLHIIANMWILWIFGDNIEDRMGRVKFILFYLICGVIAALAHYVSNPASVLPVIGASGAVAGVMGAYFLMYQDAKVLTFVPPFFFFNLPAYIFLGIWVLTQFYCAAAELISSACGPIAFWAHLGGFLAGMILYRFFINPAGSTAAD